MPTETPIDPNLVKILILDDDALVRSVLQQQLEPEGFQLTLLEGPNRALDALRTETFSVLLVDQELPNMTGLEFLGKAKEIRPEAIRLLLTSSLSVKELVDAVKSNLIHRFISKPWLREELLLILRNSVACQLSHAPIPAAPAAASAPAETESAEPSESAAPSNGRFTSVDSGDLACDIFVKMLGTFHPNLGNTAERTRVLCRTIADVIDLPPQEAHALVWAAAVHDVAMVSQERGVVRRWLRGAEKCSDEEMALVKRHPKESEEILKQYPVFEKVGEIVRCHHENWDGTGYPDRLKGEMIPWLARLLAPAIFFCSKFQGGIQAMKDLEAQSDKMFDPRAVEIVGKAVPRTELPRGMREILLIELQAGMILAKDIYNSSGVCILAKGREMTSAWVNKINSINNTTPLDPLVLVYC